MNNLRIGLSDLENNIRYWVRQSDLGLTGPWKNSTSTSIIWGVSNCIFRARKVTDSITEWEWKAYKNSAYPDEVTCHAWNVLMEKLKGTGCIPDFEPLNDTANKLQYQYLEYFEDKPKEYEEEFKANRRDEYTEPFWTDEQKNQQVEIDWQIKLRILNPLIEERKYLASRANMTPERAADEYFKTFEQAAQPAEEEEPQSEPIVLAAGKPGRRYELSEQRRIDIVVGYYSQNASSLSPMALEAYLWDKTSGKVYSSTFYEWKEDLENRGKIKMEKLGKIKIVQKIKPENKPES